MYSESVVESDFSDLPGLLPTGVTEWSASAEEVVGILQDGEEHENECASTEFYIVSREQRVNCQFFTLQLSRV